MNQLEILRESLGQCDEIILDALIMRNRIVELRISLAVSMPFNNGMMMSRKIRSTGIVRRAVNRSSPLEYGYRVSEKSFFSAQ